MGSFIAKIEILGQEFRGKHLGSYLNSLIRLHIGQITHFRSLIKIIPSKNGRFRDVLAAKTFGQFRAASKLSAIF